MIEEKLQALGLSLPAAATPQFEYVPVVLHGGLAWVSGQLPKVGEDIQVRGKVGAEVDLAVAQDCARICTLQALACLKQALTDLARIERALKVTGFVASAPGFNEQPKVIDAASKLLGSVLGEAGRHARSAVGVAELPRNAPVEIEFVFAVRG